MLISDDGFLLIAFMAWCWIIGIQIFWYFASEITEIYSWQIIDGIWAKSIAQMY